MPERASRKADRARWRDKITEHLRDFRRQYAALETAMATFGDNFDVRVFKGAFDTEDDMEAYNRVQAVERAVGRVQNYVADLAEAGVKLAELPQPATPDHGSRAEQAFEALRDAAVINGALCRRLVRAQGAGRRLEHSYVRITAGDVHRTAELVHESARDFIPAYRKWIEPYIESAADGPPTN